MPNITSVITDLAGSAIVSKFSNQSKPKDNSNQSSGGLGSGINLSSALTHITTAISSSSLGKSKGSKENQSTIPEPNQQMSGYPPNPTQVEAAVIQPEAVPTLVKIEVTQVERVPIQWVWKPYPGYPPQQPAAQTGYGGNSQQGIGFSLDNPGGGGYPSQQSYPGYNSSSGQSPILGLEEGMEEVVLILAVVGDQATLAVKVNIQRHNSNRYHNPTEVDHHLLEGSIQLRQSTQSNSSMEDHPQHLQVVSLRIPHRLVVQQVSHRIQHLEVISHPILHTLVVNLPIQHHLQADIPAPDPKKCFSQSTPTIKPTLFQCESHS
uniref:Uncharacterized protein n=1 Tax=Ditylenchus dipsaci TaxID=166011 RepID=A0A915EVJ1_9BILA